VGEIKSEMEQGIAAAGDAVVISDGQLFTRHDFHRKWKPSRLALLELKGPTGTSSSAPRERLSLLQALDLSKRIWLGIIFTDFFRILHFSVSVYASTTLSFSADKSSDMRPPLSLLLASSASFSSTSVEKSLAFCNATFPQCSSVTASTGVPPSLEI